MDGRPRTPSMPHPCHGRPPPKSSRRRILAGHPTLHPRHGRPALNSSTWDLRVGGMGSRPRWWPEEIQWCPGGSGGEGVALAIGGRCMRDHSREQGLLKLFGWSCRSWSRPPPSALCHTPPASLSAAAGTAGRCLLTAMARASTTGRRGPEPPCHSSLFGCSASTKRSWSRRPPPR
ncbi:hypothetical protein VPH35_136636 [Triticum aestivum]